MTLEGDSEASKERGDKRATRSLNKAIAKGRPDGYEAAQCCFTAAKRPETIMTVFSHSTMYTCCVPVK